MRLQLKTFGWNQTSCFFICEISWCPGLIDFSATTQMLLVWHLWFVAISHQPSKVSNKKSNPQWPNCSCTSRANVENTSKPPPVGVMVWSNPCQISWDDLHCNKNVCYAALTRLFCILKFCHKYCPFAMSTNSQNTDLPLPWAYISEQENSDARWLNVNGFLNHTVRPLTPSNMRGKSGGLISFW